MRRSFRSGVVAALVAIALVSSSAVVHADNLEADGDTASSSSTTAAFGSVCVGSSNSKPVALFIRRTGEGTNVFKNSAAVTISRGTLSGTGLSAPSGSLGTISLPSNWEGLANNQVSSSLTSSVTYAPTAAGSLSGTVEYSATGPNTSNNSITRSTSIAATGSATACDTTPPVIVPTVTGSAGNAGWYVGDVSVTWSVTDAQSPVTSTTGCGSSTVTSDTGGQTFTCSATSSGGTASESVTIKRDATPPTSVTASASPAANTAGWHNQPFTATWTGSDALSGIAACTSTAYSGPETGAGSLSGSCTDVAGNTSAPVAFGFKYDTTAPVVLGEPDRTPDHDGWYNQPVTITWAPAPGEGSGFTCDAPTTYSGPDSSSVTRSGSCTDAAGNSGTGSFGAFKYDATAPTASIALDRAPDHNGWYNASVTGVTTGSDATSGIASCTADQPYAADGTGLSLSGSCTDAAGNESSIASVSFKYDGTAPIATIALDRGPDHNGWYNALVTATTTGTDATSGIASCDADQDYDGPDGTNRSLSGGCTDEAGNESIPSSVTFDYDGTAPGIALQSRLPAANGFGWNKAAVTVTWSCTDAASGPVTTSVSDTVSAEGSGQSASGSCEDVAGNTASASESPINVDLTAPNAPTLSTDRVPEYIDGTTEWFSGSVTVSSAHNGDPGADPSGVDTSTVASPVTKSTSGSHVISDLVDDKAGNTSAAASRTVWVDATAPVVTLACPSAPIILNATASAGWSASDAHSGLATLATGSVPLDTATVGTRSASLPAGSAVDNVGNQSAAASCSYTVAFGYSGFLQPINDTAHQTGVNQSRFKLGSTIPAKFRLTDAAGVAVQQVGTPRFSSRRLGGTCDSVTSVEAESAPTATSGSEFKWSATDRQYHFNVSTKGWNAGEYRIFVTGLDDGRSYYTDLCLAR